MSFSPLSRSILPGGCSSPPQRLGDYVRFRVQRSGAVRVYELPERSACGIHTCNQRNKQGNKSLSFLLLRTLPSVSTEEWLRALHGGNRGGKVGRDRRWHHIEVRRQLLSEARVDVETVSRGIPTEYIHRFVADALRRLKVQSHSLQPRVHDQANVLSFLPVGFLRPSVRCEAYVQCNYHGQTSGDRRSPTCGFRRPELRQASDQHDNRHPPAEADGP